MKNQHTLKTVRAILDQLRANPKTQRRFPQEVWDSIVQLT